MAVWWLLYDKRDIERNKEYIGMYFTACRQRGISLTLMTEEDLSVSVSNTRTIFMNRGEELDFPDAVMNRTRSFHLAKRLELLGCRVFNNSDVTLLGNDKELALSYVKGLGIDIMPYRAGADFGFDRFPCVMKSVDGHGGTEVFWVDGRETFASLRGKFPGRRCIWQEPAADIGKDLRVYVIGNQVVASMLRTSKTDFRSNFCLGGEAHPYRLLPEEEKIVGRILESLRIDFGGIDFIFHQGKLIFNEIEDVVGARMLYAYTDMDVVELFVSHILENM
ncbi:MAG: hypothetical protein HFG41_06500 [Coprococcus sp.]|nr:hypothetical protein [Coprococcus sp.]